MPTVRWWWALERLRQSRFEVDDRSEKALLFSLLTRHDNSHGLPSRKAEKHLLPGPPPLLLGER